METARIDIAYRPLRVAWVIRSDDFVSFRKAVRLSHTLWGGRYNPIVFADRPKEANDLIEVFRADMLMPLGSSPEVVSFESEYPHLQKPYFGEGLFSGTGDDATALLLDIANALVFARDKRELDDLQKANFRTFTWDAADPLADVLLMQVGAYPEKADCPIDYGSMFAEALGATEDTIPANEPLPTRIAEHPSIAYMSRHNLQRHYGIQVNWDYPGFFLGDVSNLDDLVTFWNLRAADNTLQFVDRANFARFEQLNSLLEKRILEGVAHLDEHNRCVAVWTRTENIEDAGKRFEGRPIRLIRVDQVLWNGLNINSPMMILGKASTLGVIGESSGRRRISFALADKPVTGNFWYHDQHLVASVSLIGDMFDPRHTFLPPYAPELNTFLGRSMYYMPMALRIEPERLGIVIDTADNDAFLNSISPEEFFVELFKHAHVSAKPSAAGLLARQLITQVGGVNGGRVFKIPGVRRLIKERGPMDSFTDRVALQTIGGADPDRPNAKFEDHKNLFIEQRAEPHLTPAMAFAYLVEKGLFRIGADLACPTCSLTGWTSLDSLKTKMICEFCGTDFDATRQLVSGTWRYRRSGLLGRERNVHGAIPVVLTLQQLYVNLGVLGGRALYLPSYEMEGLQGFDFEKCEVDFLFMSRGRDKPEIIIGECKDRHDGINATDIHNLKRVGALFPKERFEVYYLLSKLGKFTDAEIDLAATLNDDYHLRIILLTADELEPYHIYDRAADEAVKKSYASTARDLAKLTAHLYFQARAKTKGKRSSSKAKRDKSG